MSESEIAFLCSWLWSCAACAEQGGSIFLCSYQSMCHVTASQSQHEQWNLTQGWLDLGGKIRVWGGGRGRACILPVSVLLIMEFYKLLQTNYASLYEKKQGGNNRNSLTRWALSVGFHPTAEPANPTCHSEQNISLWDYSIKAQKEPSCKTNDVEVTQCFWTIFCPLVSISVPVGIKNSITGKTCSSYCRSSNVRLIPQSSVNSSRKSLFFPSLGVFIGRRKNDYCDSNITLGNPDNLCLLANLDMKALYNSALSASSPLTAEIVSPATFTTYTSANHTLLKSSG